MMDEAAAREIERLKSENAAIDRRLTLAISSIDYWRNAFENSERQRKQLSEYIETLAKGGIEAATGAGK